MRFCALLTVSSKSRRLIVESEVKVKQTFDVMGSVVRNGPRL
jgi:hypothetical protein